MVDASGSAQGHLSWIERVLAGNVPVSKNWFYTCAFVAAPEGRPVYFEHVIQVNDLNKPLLAVIPRDTLWRGLLRRAERPQDFLPDLAQGEIIERGDGWFRRVVQMGTLQVHDRVTLHPGERLHYDTAAGEGYPASSLTVSIEEPEADALFVRFVYQSELPEQTPADGEVDYIAYLKSAYQQMDIDALVTLRQMVEAGELE